MTPWPVRALRVKDAAAAASLHARCFDAPWPAADFAELIAEPQMVSFGCDDGASDLAALLLMRRAVGQSDTVTVCVAPEHRRSGLAASLFRAAFAHLAQEPGHESFLEVAVSNMGALALYGRLGFAEVGRRKAYYRRAPGVYEDALVLRLDLTHRPSALA